MLAATQLAHHLVRAALKPGAWVVDATLGNGFDTLFLAECVGATGRVFGFDVQAAALAATAERVRGLPQVTLIESGHERLRERLPRDAEGRLAAVMFNLGYLPGAPKDVTTTSPTTLDAMDQALDLLSVGGLITMVLYRGHPGGEAESDGVLARAERLPSNFAASLTQRVNAASPAPALLVIERLR